MDNKSKQSNFSEFARSLASVSANAGKVDVLVFGAGIGGLSMLQALHHYEGVDIKAIVDIIDDAPAFELARKLGIQTSTDGEAMLAGFSDGILIDVTGDPGQYKRLHEFSQPQHIELISAKSAKLLFDLVDHQLNDERTILQQKRRLNLLDTLLEISMLLEQRVDVGDVTTRSLQGISDHVDAAKGIAIMFAENGGLEFVGTVGCNKPLCETSSRCNIDIARTIHEITESMAGEERFKQLIEPITFDCPGLQSSFNTIVPFWRHKQVAGALLFNVDGRVTKEQKLSLKMASIHLNMTYKTLEQLNKLEEMATFDALTGVFNRRKFDIQLQYEVSRTRRNSCSTLSCGFIDIDNFKQINDIYGHHVGDKVLQHVSKSIHESLRDYDICARYGGDEFVMLLPSDDVIRNESLEAIGRRILAKISSFSITEHPGIKASVSIGVATQSNETVDAEKLLKQADEALYEAKKAGKGCLRIRTDEQFHID